MGTIRVKSLIGSSLVLAAIAGLPPAAPVARAGDPGPARVERTGEVRIVVVDEDGNRHEESYRFEGDAPRAYLGVRVGREPAGGARVEHVIEGSPAERAGLRTGDVIVGFAGETLEGPWDLTRRVLEAEAGTSVELDVVRDGDRRSLAVEPGERDDWAEMFGHGPGRLGEHLHGRLGGLDLDFGPLHGFAFSHRPRLGVRLIQPTPELREHLGADPDAGVLVGKVLPGTPAENSDLRVGDLIVAVDGEAVEDAGDLVRALADRQGAVIELDVVRDGRRMTLGTRIPEDEEVEGPGPRA